MSEKGELLQEGIFIPTIFSAELIDKDDNKHPFIMACEPCIEESTENFTVMKCRLMDEERRDKMKIEKVTPNKDDKEIEKLRLYEDRIEQNGMTDSFIGIDSNGNLRYVIKHLRTVKGMSTIIVELYNDRGIVAIGGGYNVDADIALLKALEQLGLKINKQELKKANLWSPTMGKRVEWYKNNLEELMNSIMSILGNKSKIRIYKITAFARNNWATLTDGFYYK